MTMCLTQRTVAVIVTLRCEWDTMERDTARDLTHTYCKPSWPLSVTKTLKTMGTNCQRAVQRYNGCFNTRLLCQNNFVFLCFTGVKCDFCSSQFINYNLCVLNSHCNNLLKCIIDSKVYNINYNFAITTYKKFKGDWTWCGRQKPPQHWDLSY